MLLKSSMFIWIVLLEMKIKLKLRVKFEYYYDYLLFYHTDIPLIQCLRNEYACSNGIDCIPGHWECDGIHDCADGGDEINCGN